MAGNTFGRYLRIMTFGESHGPALGVVMDGVRPGLKFSVAAIQKELDRRRPGQSKVTTPRNEPDRVEVLSGVFEGKTTGMPVCMIIRNTDQRPAAYEKIKTMFRPGHAGYTYLAKYGIVDYRGGGRSSGRETAARVAAGAFAKEYLQEQGIRILAHTTEIGGIVASRFDPAVIEQNPLRCADSTAAQAMEDAVMAARDDGDSLGGIVEIRVNGLPPGLGDPVFDRLNADLAHAMMSIGAVKGVEFGSGFAAARMKGSENNDPMYMEAATGRVRTRTNNAGGTAGGITNGEELVLRIAVKPTSSIRKEQDTVTVDGEPARITVHGRHDPCICPRVVPVAESMAALTIMDHLTRQRLLRGSKGKKAQGETVELIDRDINVLRLLRKQLSAPLGKRARTR
ncbi:MAG: chorismate synthase [Ignavibacteriae bacterium]|nr:chorismate synthase [Ignavibacteriota bacterium]